jgi:hypothetical protein
MRIAIATNNILLIFLISTNFQNQKQFLGEMFPIFERCKIETTKLTHVRKRPGPAQDERPPPGAGAARPSWLEHMWRRTYEATHHTVRMYIHVTAGQINDQRRRSSAPPLSSVCRRGGAWETVPEVGAIGHAQQAALLQNLSQIPLCVSKWRNIRNFGYI